MLSAHCHGARVTLLQFIKNPLAKQCNYARTLPVLCLTRYNALHSPEFVFLFFSSHFLRLFSLESMTYTWRGPFFALCHVCWIFLCIYCKRDSLSLLFVLSFPNRSLLLLLPLCEQSLWLSRDGCFPYFLPQSRTAHTLWEIFSICWFVFAAIQSCHLQRNRRARFHKRIAHNFWLPILTGLPLFWTGYCLLPLLFRCWEFFPPLFARTHSVCEGKSCIVFLWQNYLCNASNHFRRCYCYLFTSSFFFLFFSYFRKLRRLCGDGAS